MTYDTSTRPARLVSTSHLGAGDVYVATIEGGANRVLSFTTRRGKY